MPARTDGGKLVGGGGGLEPALHSPGLDLDASEHRYVRIRMNNPDTRQSGYLLLTTADDPEFDLPGDGVPPPNEKGLKGIAFSLVPGAEYTEYVLDMATVPGWKGTITQLKVQPFTRWNYHVADVDISWHGGIDSIRID
ncbi:hypothetical protein [Streptomyces anulatus]|uniref:hypothetical protein n=1 Tax=Streptomyces anulatus TaxID=1892 RepID=UPI0036319593